MEKEQNNEYTPLFEEGNIPSFNGEVETITVDPQRARMIHAMIEISNDCENIHTPTLIADERGSIIKSMMKPSTKQYFRVSSNQYTIPKNSIGNYDGILNKTGRTMYKMIKNKAVEGKFDGYIEEYKIDRGYRSGCWFFDKTSKWYEPDMCNYLHSFDNKCVVGIHTVDGKRKPITTSPIIFYTDTWCYTKDGSLYKLGTKVDEESLNDEIRRYNDDHGIPNEY